MVLIGAYLNLYLVFRRTPVWKAGERNLYMNERMLTEIRNIRQLSEFTLIIAVVNKGSIDLISSLLTLITDYKNSLKVIDELGNNVNNI